MPLPISGTPTGPSIEGHLAQLHSCELQLWTAGGLAGGCGSRWPITSVARSSYEPMSDRAGTGAKPGQSRASDTTSARVSISRARTGCQSDPRHSLLADTTHACSCETTIVVDAASMPRPSSGDFRKRAGSFVCTRSEIPICVHVSHDVGGERPGGWGTALGLVRPATKRRYTPPFPIHLL